MSKFSFVESFLFIIKWFLTFTHICYTFSKYRLSVLPPHDLEASSNKLPFIDFVIECSSAGPLAVLSQAWSVRPSKDILQEVLWSTSVSKGPNSSSSSPPVSKGCTRVFQCYRFIHCLWLAADDGHEAQSWARRGEDEVIKELMNSEVVKGEREREGGGWLGV